MYHYMVGEGISREPAYFTVLNDGNRQVFQKFLENVPAHVSTLWGYEVRLKDPELPSDFQMCVSRDSYSSFAKYLSTVPFDHWIWGNFRNLTSRWMDGKDPLCVLLKNVWLELDADQMRTGCPVPNFFFATTRGLKTNDLRKVINYIFSVLGVKLEQSELNSLVKINDSLPGKARIAQIGMMMARPGVQPVRLYVHRIKEQELFPFLTKIGYFLEPKEFNGLLREMHEVFDFVDVNVETTHDTYLHQIGLEGYVRVWNDQKLIRILSFLEKKGLVDKRYSSRLRDYLNVAMKGIGSHEEFIHHFKLSYSGLNGCDAKVYLGVRRKQIWSKFWL